ncbi:MAG: hypothetical protein ACO1SV_00780 [Fimbriimonas sp.]
MSARTQRETRSGYPTFGLPSGVRSGLGFDLSNNPQILDTTGAVAFAATATQGVARTLKIAIPAVTGDPAIVSSTLNPFGFDVIIQNALLDATTAASGSATLDVGVGANASASNDGLFDGLTINGATGLFDPVKNGGTNGRPSQVWGATQYLNVARATGNANGWTATLNVTVKRR